MSDPVPIPALAQSVATLVTMVMSEVRPKLVQAALSGDRAENVNLRHTDNFLSVHDMWMHRRYRDLLESSLGSFVYASEEAEPIVVGNDPDPGLCVLVDPLDTSELAVRGLNGYTHVVVYSRELSRPIVSVVGDIFHHIQLYIGVRDENGTDRAFVTTADQEVFPLRCGVIKPLHEALLTNFLMRPSERFVPLARQERLIEALGQRSADGKARGRIGIDFGSVGLCHVAAGFADAMVEFAKGFAIWDLMPGHHILHAAGGTVIGLDGKPLSLDYRLDTLSDIRAAMSGRRRFIAAGGLALAHEVLSALDV